MSAGDGVRIATEDDQRDFPPLDLHDNMLLDDDDDMRAEAGSPPPDLLNLEADFEDQPPSETLNDDIPQSSPEMCYFDQLTATENKTDEAEEKLESLEAVAGVCGMKNIGNTCFMNSGLQCIFATPSIVDFFLRYVKITNDDPMSVQEKQTSAIPRLGDTFGPLLRDVWSGRYGALTPRAFKDALGLINGQFLGHQQHDCQEFLAVLLDALHEELKVISSGERFTLRSEPGINVSEGGTSMELHLPRSVKEDDMKDLRSSSLEDSSTNGLKTFETPPSSSASSMVSSTCGKEKKAQQNDNSDGNESRGSTSPKSYDSQSSVEDKVASSIRHMPIPADIKADYGLMQIDSEDESSNLSSSSSSHRPNIPTSNLVAPNSLKKPPTGLAPHPPSTNSRIEDFIKDSGKTLNVNVLPSDANADEGSLMNNELNFDSEKFASSRRRTQMDKSETIDNLAFTDANGSPPQGLPLEFNGIKRIRLDSEDKNFKHEMERNSTGEEKLNKLEGAKALIDKEGASNISYIHSAEERGAAGGSGSSSHRPNLKEAIEADRYWEKYLAANDTVIARTFQGLFKNTVICSKCQYPSITFEPFMYLPVPLPNAMIKQIEVTFVGEVGGKTDSIAILLDMTQADDVGSVKKSIGKVLLGEDVDEKCLDDFVASVQAVESYNHRITRTVEDWTLLRHLSEDRDLFVIRPIQDKLWMKSLIEEDTSNWSNGATLSKPESQGIAYGPHPNNSTEILPVEGTPPPSPKASQPLITCTHCCVICMEELPSEDVCQHNACTCIMCVPCIERTAEHHETVKDLPVEGHIRCPGCREVADPSVEFVALDLIGKSKPKIRALTLSMLHRKISDDNTVTLFGCPGLIVVPNQVTGKKLREMVSLVIKENDSFNITLVDSMGKLCSRCLFSDRCLGCIIITEENQEDNFILQSSDNLAITILCEDVKESRYSATPHLSFNQQRLPVRLTLEECLEAFSQSETLDENNPWFCPKCRKNQCATKTLSVWRFPEYLIIYLKRFVFVNRCNSSVKLERPVEVTLRGLDLTRFMSGPLAHEEERPKFDLYAAVNHFGTVGGGHYTAFAKHEPTLEWNYFDDSNMEARSPDKSSKVDQSAAYVLFYSKRGASRKFCLPRTEIQPVKEEPLLLDFPETLSTAQVTSVKQHFNVDSLI